MGNKNLREQMIDFNHILTSLKHSGITKSMWSIRRLLWRLEGDTLNNLQLVV